MTTIIIVVVVALVFFVAVCVVTFMVWKRESEMRTDSIKAIEENLEKLTSDMAQTENDQHTDESPQTEELHDEPHMNTGTAVSEEAVAELASADKAKEPGKDKSRDPFSWVREGHQNQVTEEKAETETDTTDTDEINLDFIEEIDQAIEETSGRQETDQEEGSEYGSDKGGILDDLDKDLNDDFDYEAEPRTKIGYDVGKSGRKYTASELETLIKE